MSRLYSTIQHTPKGSRNSSDIFADTPLTLDDAQDLRIAQISGNTDASKPWVFVVPAPDKVPFFIAALIGMKQGKSLPPSDVERDLKQQMRANIGNSVLDSELKGLLSTRQHVEVMLALDTGHLVALSMSPEGFAYVDPQGKGRPSVNIRLPNGKSAPLTQVLPSSWCSLYGKSPKTPAEQQEVQSKIQFHANAKQNNAGRDVEWVCGALSVLHNNIAATSEDIKQTTLGDNRKAVVAQVNEQRSARSKPALTFQEGPQDALLYQAWREQVAAVKARHQGYCDDAKISCDPPPHYEPDDKDPNAYMTKRSDGVTNTFNINEKELQVASTGASTYSDAFKRMAEDMRAVYCDEDGTLCNPPIMLNRVEPKEHQETCQRAFEAVFGTGNVVGPWSDAANATKPGAADSSTVVATPVSPSSP